MATITPPPPPPYVPPASTNTAGPPLANFASPGTINGISQNTGPNGAYLQTVDPTSLASYQYAQLARSDNPIVRNAAQNAQAYAAARGGGVSGTQAIDASNRSMFNELEPVASADASRYGDVGNLNQQMLNANEQERMGNQAQITSSQISAGASRYASDERQHEFDTSQSNRAQDRTWQLADQDTAARASARSQFMNQVEGSIFSDPSVWRDPQGAMGMLNEYGTNFDSWFSSAFPEYNSDGENNTPPPSTPYQEGQAIGGGR